MYALLFFPVTETDFKVEPLNPEDEDHALLPPSSANGGTAGQEPPGGDPLEPGKPVDPITDVVFRPIAGEDNDGSDLLPGYYYDNNYGEDLESPDVIRHVVPTKKPRVPTKSTTTTQRPSTTTFLYRQYESYDFYDYNNDFNLGTGDAYMRHRLALQQRLKLKQKLKQRHRLYKYRRRHHRHHQRHRGSS